jgi:hypothetical protein
MASLFGGLPTPSFVLGYGGEILRGFYHHRGRPMENLGAKSQVSAYGSSIRQGRPSDESLCAAFFEDFRVRANYDVLNAFTYNPNDIFYGEHRMGMCRSAMLNELDIALYSRVGFKHPDKKRFSEFH